MFSLHSWRSKRKSYIRAYIIANVINVCTVISFAIALGLSFDDNSSTPSPLPSPSSSDDVTPASSRDGLVTAYYAYSALVSAILVILSARYAAALRDLRIMSNEAGQLACYRSYIVVVGVLLICRVPLLHRRCPQANSSFVILIASSMILTTLLLLLSLPPSSSLSSLLSPHFTDPNTIEEILVTSVVFIVLASRCVFDIIGCFVDGADSPFRISVDSSKSLTALSFALIVLWEITPTLTSMSHLRNLISTDCFPFSAIAFDTMNVRHLFYCILSSNLTSP